MSKILTWNDFYLPDKNFKKEKEIKSIGKLPFCCKKDMIFVQGGTFLMGLADTNKISFMDAKPQHKVKLADFYIGKYEITQDIWEFVMNNNPSDQQGDKLPVTNVSWNDIVDNFLPAFNKIMGKNFTLPTEAQWEYAARGGQCFKEYLYAGSNNLDEVAWYNSNSKNKTHEVGKKKPNELGIFDMSGNVDEWCMDFYDANYYEKSVENNPTGPTTGLYRVARGGNFSTFAKYCPILYRHTILLELKPSTVGFRLVYNL